MRYLLSVFLIFFASLHPAVSADLEDYFEKKSAEYSPQDIEIEHIQNGSLKIVIKDKIPESEFVQKKVVLDLINKNYDKSVPNITVEWLPDCFSYSKLFILPNVYLQSYQNGLISHSKLLKLINLRYKIENIVVD